MQFDLQAKHAADFSARETEREREIGGLEKTATRADPITERGDGRGQRRVVLENGQVGGRRGEKDSALKNADEAEVKESSYASEISSRSLSSPHPCPAIFVCSRLSP